MDIQELAKKLQQDGVDKGKEEAEKIKASALEEAKKIKQSAEEEKEKILAQAKEEISKMENSGKQNLQLAARDVTLQLKKDIEKMINSIVKRKVAVSLTDKDVVKDLMQTLVKQYDSQQKEHSAKFEMPSKLSSDLESWLVSELKAECKKNDSLAGFLLHDSDGGCIEITAESVQDTISPYLSEMVKGILAQEN